MPFAHYKKFMRPVTRIAAAGRTGDRGAKAKKERGTFIPRSSIL
jgi:hypothetical protein